MLHDFFQFDGIGNGNFEEALLDRGHIKQYNGPVLLFSSIVLSFASSNSENQPSCLERGITAGFAAIQVALQVTFGLLGGLTNDVAGVDLSETPGLCKSC